MLWHHVLLFIIDSVPPGLKDGQALCYPKMTRFICLAHAFHRMAEVVGDNYPKVCLFIL